MANPNDRNQNYRNNRGGFSQSQPHREASEAAVPFPEDYVDFAENLMRTNSRNITTSKLRNILSQLMDVYNTEILRTDEHITQESVVKLQMARIRIAYEYGRGERWTKEFITATNLLPWIKEIGDSREKVLHYIHYLEALVAYHRFFGGREN